MRRCLLTYRIYTEDLGNIPEIVSQYFEGFTVFEAVGYWKGKREKTSVVEVITNERVKVYEMARTLKELNRQENVLVVPVSVSEGVLV